MLPSLDGYAFERTALGRGAETYRLSAADRPTLYLKVAPDLAAEHERLRWAAGRLPVPAVIAFDGHRLLLGELAGTPNTRDVEQLARILRNLHAIPIAECPYDARVATRLAQAALNVQAGVVDESDFDDERRGCTAESVLAELRAWPAFVEDLVVAHGDFSLPNVHVNPPGLLDLGRLGVADRHADLALIMRDLDHDADAFAAAYGGPIDPTKLAFFRMLDELF
jgi:aminoglycoside phosphotransferase